MHRAEAAVILGDVSIAATSIVAVNDGLRVDVSSWVSGALFLDSEGAYTLTLVLPFLQEFKTYQWLGLVWHC
jgi:hypothetical protein